MSFWLWMSLSLSLPLRFQLTPRILALPLLDIPCRYHSIQNQIVNNPCDTLVPRLLFFDPIWICLTHCQPNRQCDQFNASSVVCPKKATKRKKTAEKSFHKPRCRHQTAHINTHTHTYTRARIEITNTISSYSLLWNLDCYYWMFDELQLAVAKTSRHFIHCISLSAYRHLY